MTLRLEYAFTLRVDLAPPHQFGKTAAGERRFIPITGRRSDGPKTKGKILSHGVVDVFAKYTIEAEAGTLVNVTSERYGRASQETMWEVFEDDPSKASMKDGGAAWYTKTFPRFEVAPGPVDWLNSTCFPGDLRPPKLPKRVIIDVYEIS
ncbi:hypothetical protein BU16DRAFT_549025 [Lophium mytilinum]|uniref:Uncharacterized protein n=1 Tax=Lophium mytilinum TaxID=390894 RepID=A0A6A6QZG6_9PEZI|nr:hypothetical protein BU16DRAFT_549025 [Lophium mytilinum]